MSNGICAMHRPAGPFTPATVLSPVLVNDRHSLLNPTWVTAVSSPKTIDELQACVRRAAASGVPVAICGSRHAMGGQQFGTDVELLDMRGLNRVLRFDKVRGLVEVEAGIEWPKLIDDLAHAQAGEPVQWGISQKQTGADNLTLGGAVSANIHGRGLRMRPFIGDVESVTVVDPNGDLVRCSRHENQHRFQLVVGGYGLFGAVYSVELRLTRRRKVRRVVEVRDIDSVMEGFDDRIRDGALFGDFQYCTDENSEDFLRKGVLSCYETVPDDTPIPDSQRNLSDHDWRNLIHLAHADKALAYDQYARHYLATHGQVYWSDTHQLSTYLDGYHAGLDCQLGARHAGSEVITEMYVPRAALAEFMKNAAEDFRRHGVNVIYGTVRLIKPDGETFLAWATQPWACIIFNLHTDHTCASLEHTADAFRRLNDSAISYGGTFYLTYHRYATREQLLTCYPQLPEFLRLKRRYDPEERFQSDWYAHMKRVVAGR